MRIGTAWPALALALALAAPARAQDLGGLPFGARVRLTMHGRSAPFVGELRSVLDDTLVVAESMGAPDSLVPLARIRRVEVYRGRESGWAFTVLGVVVGGAAGALLAYNLWAPTGELEGDDILTFLLNLALQSGPAATAVFGGLLGATVGGAAGHAADRRERWENVRPERFRIGAVPLAGGRVAIGVAIGF